MTNLQLARDSIRLSYLRFLSDGAVGLLIITLLVALLSLDVAASGFSLQSFMDRIAPGEPSSEVRIFFLISGLLLAVPLGAIVNFTGWFILGPVQVLVSQKLLSTRLWPLTWSTDCLYDRKLLVEEFELTPDNFYTASLAARRYLEAHYPKILAEHNAHTGVKRFVRSISLLLLLLGAWVAIMHSFLWGTILVLLGIFTMALLGGLAYYEALFIFSELRVVLIEAALPITELNGLLAQILGRRSLREGRHG